MLQLRQLYLKLAFPRARALGENIKNQRGPIQNLAAENLLEVPALSRRQLIIENDGVDVGLAAETGEFLRFAGPDKCARTRRLQLLHAIADHLAAGRAGQLRKLFDGIAGFPTVAVAIAIAAFDLDADEKYPLSPPVAGLDQCFQFL